MTPEQKPSFFPFMAIHGGWIIALLTVSISLSVIFWPPSESPDQDNVGKSIDLADQQSDRYAAIAGQLLANYEQENAELREDKQRLLHQQAALTLAIQAIGECNWPHIDTPSVEAAFRHLEAGDTRQAEGVLEAIIEEKTVEGLAANKEAAEAARHLGAFAALHDVDKAIEAYRVATELDPSNYDSWVQLNYLYTLGGHFSGAALSSENMIKVGEENGDSIQVATGNLFLAKAFSRGGRPLPALRAAGKANTLFKVAGSPLGIADSAWFWGVLYRPQGQLGDAEEKFLEAQTIYEKWGDVSDVSQIKNSRGVIFQIQGEWEEACRLFQEGTSQNPPLTG